MSSLPPATPSCEVGRCITCSDDAVAMAVLRVDEQRGLALCAEAAGVQHTVETALVEPVAAGEQVLVHAGVAIASLRGERDATLGPAPPGRRPAPEVRA